LAGRLSKNRRKQFTGRVPASVFDYIEQVASDTAVMSDAAPEINSDP
jgi:hypothetical protein